MITAYFIYCSTGCSCCSYDNHFSGPFSTREIAEKMRQEFIDGRKLSSQFSVAGRYLIEEEEAEQLLDGRLIINDRVFPGWADDDGWKEAFKEW